MSLRDVGFGVEDDRTPVLTTNAAGPFKSLKTIPVFSFHLFISTLISFIGVVLAIRWPDSKRCEAYFIMLYLRAAFWLLSLIIDHITKHHHEKLRLNGYIDFHKSIAVHRGCPFYIVTLWNNVIIVIQALMQHYYGEHFNEHCIKGFFSPIIYITLFHITESLFLFMIVGSYIGRVYRFNQIASPPDASTGIVGYNSGSIGVDNSQSHLQELLENQADLINYLRDQNANLNQKLIQLNTEIKSLTGERE